MSTIHDDKSQYCVPFILDRYRVHEKEHEAEESPRPLFVGLNGVQGAGKTTLVTGLATKLRSLHLPTCVLSIDSLYLTHADQRLLAQSFPSNPLLQHRGQPSTHDVSLGLEVFGFLKQNLPTKLPDYDKSAFNGEGDRVAVENWEVVNDEFYVEKEGSPAKVILFEGWCVGFRALGEPAIRKLWEDAVKERELDETKYEGRLGYNKLEDLVAIDTALEKYEAFTEHFDALIHIDAENTQYVYEWRLEQERSLRTTRGSGMTDEQVRKFVDGYYPAYELYLVQLREGLFMGSDHQLHLLVNRDRRVIKATVK